MTNDKDILIILNSPESYITLDNLIDNVIDYFDCTLGYCPWIVQPELLVKEDKLIGLTYSLPSQYIILVSNWLEKINNSHAKIKKISSSNYYNIKDYSTDYMFEVFWLNEKPDRTEGLAIVEDFWLFSKNISEKFLNNVFAIGLSNPHQVAKDHNLKWTF
ncbi:MAG: hypothetical protein EOO69_10930 [Moraxellaceae bacterium]|nr:MAG: hypothetical protein EOO69_10930 [Moraxellaceae bacterium]